MEIYITRHPITKEIEEGIVQGKKYGTVSKEGYEQINKLKPFLKKKKFSKIYSSDSKRAKEMAKEILKEIKIPIEYTRLIDEKDYGKFEGKKTNTIRKKDITGKTPETRRYSNGENLLDLEKRANKFIKKIIKENKKKILLISHSIFTSILVGTMIKKGLTESREDLIMDHCHVTKVKYNNKKFKLKYFNKLR